MKISVPVLWIFAHFQATKGFYSTVECPEYPQADPHQLGDSNFQSLDCTLSMSCENPSEIQSKDPRFESDCSDELFEDNSLFDCSASNDRTCSMRLKVTMLKNFEVSRQNPCPRLPDTLGPSLRPVSGNCSLFYKCDWGAPIFFECPGELHFNYKLQVCDWPWQAQCHFSRKCPRPYPICPLDYQKPIYLPHPRDCDKFYQCDWGSLYLQKCPLGLHFDPELKICDWPWKANCKNC